MSSAGASSLPKVSRPTDPVAPRVWHRERLVLLAFVFVGGTCGTWVRAELSKNFPVAADGWPWVTFWINVSGAFVLGCLLGLLARLGDDSGWRRRARLGLGTGVLGGYTTYSTFAVEVVERQRDSLLLLGAGYALASVVGGAALAALGLRSARIGGNR